MKATVRKITGMGGAIESMFMSKRSWTPELGQEIFEISECIERGETNIPEDRLNKYNSWMSKVAKIGQQHITLLRFIDIIIMTEGMHRAGQDDIDAHAMRFNNRIIRSSTRLGTFSEGEKSTFYQDKILTVTEALTGLKRQLPNDIYVVVRTDGDYAGHERWFTEFEAEFVKDEDGLYHDCLTDSPYELKVHWIRSVNGYVRAEYENDPDVRRGLYMESIPSNFISKINITEWAHVYKERNSSGHANPEVKEWAESVQDQIQNIIPFFDREYILGIQQ